MQTEQTPLLREREAAALLHLAPGTLQNKRVSGGGPPFLKVGGRILYDRMRVLEWARAHERRSTSDLDPRPEAR